MAHRLSLIHKLIKLPLVTKIIIVVVGLVVGLSVSAEATQQSYTYQQTSNVSYTIKSIDDATRLTGTSDIVTPGVEGSREDTYKITKIFGIQLSKSIIDSKSIKKPIDEVLQVGILNKTQTSEDKLIVFDKQQVDDANMLLGLSNITQSGINGLNTDIYEVMSIRGVVQSKTLIKEDVINQPLTEITNIGINYRVGAICGDGWRSYATSSGACSSHSSVDYWLYKYCSVQYSC